LLLVLTEHRADKFLPKPKHSRFASWVACIRLIDDHAIWVRVLTVMAGLERSNGMVVSILLDDSVGWRHVQIAINLDGWLRYKGVAMRVGDTV